MGVAEGPWKTPQHRPQPFEPFSPAKWHGSEPPPHDWIVDGCFLRGTVAMLSGDGGLGKSLLMQQLCTAAALGKAWLGLDTKPSRTFAMFCEDDEDELHRRQADINRHYNCDMPDLEDTLYISRAGQENVLCEFDKRTGGRAVLTPVYEQLRNAILDFGAQVIVLDTVADIFAGDEIRRTEVRRFVTILRRLAVEVQGVVILNAHPSLTGMSSGSGISGSTAWNNSVRSRLYLTRPKQEEEGETDNNERLLKTMKNNQGPYGGKIGLRWDKGVFVRTDGASHSASVVERLDLDNAAVLALRALIENGALVPADWNNRYGFANVLRTLPEFRTSGQSALISVQDRLLKQGRIMKVELGPPSKRRIYLRPADMRYPGEKEGETE